MEPMIDLVAARIEIPADMSPVERKSVSMLIDEVERRTGIAWPVSEGGQSPVISIARVQSPGPAEGYRLSTGASGVRIEGNDERGVLFGVGRLLREIDWGRWRIGIRSGLDIESSPAYPLRGHQLGYRTVNNTYDAWTPAMFEQYVRDLIIFGCNAIELIPPRADTGYDDGVHPHLHLSPMDMMVEQSRIASSYGLDVWVWFPSLGDYSRPGVVERSIAEWEEVLGRLPRVDALYIPAGDPGDCRPAPLMRFLSEAANVLHKLHPRSQIWVSQQGWDEEELAEFLAIIEEGTPWLDGLIYGPWTRVSIQELRQRAPQKYPIRHCPDITHCMHSEFTFPNWDLAYALTYGRESSNPQPVTARTIFQATAPSTVGFITYSDGAHDDVNKFLWSSLGWDPNSSMVDVCRQYARCFISSQFGEQIAQSLFNLEANWIGELATNSGVDITLRQLQSIERDATPQMRLNWRFQLILYRAYYDAYVRHRLLNDIALEHRALECLRKADRTGSLIAMSQAERILDEAVAAPVAHDLRSRVFELGEALYQSIHAQLSVDRHAAIAVNRGASLDTIDRPLNNRWWLKTRFAAIRAIDNEKDRVDAIDAVLGRADPGPGGFYDSLGNPTAQPHLVYDGPDFAQDPGAYHSVRTGYIPSGGGLIGTSSRDANDPEGDAAFLATPTAWWTWAETRYETPLTIRYDRLDPTAAYILRVVVAVERTGRRFRLIANDEIEVHSWIKRPSPIQSMEFAIPPAAVAMGTLTLRWHVEPGGGSFDSSMAISEVFLIRTSSRGETQ